MIKRICSICKDPEIPADTIKITRDSWQSDSMDIYNKRELCLKCLSKLEDILIKFCDENNPDKPAIGMAIMRRSLFHVFTIHDQIALSSLKKPEGSK